MFSVVDNRYRGEGFAFVIENQPQEDRWKNTQHGDYADKATADAHAALLNEAWGVA